MRPDDLDIDEALAFDFQAARDAFFEHISAYTTAIRIGEGRKKNHHISVHIFRIGSVQDELCDAERALDDLEAETVSVEVVEQMLHRIHAATEKETT